MVRLTILARVRDGLPLAEGLDREKDPNLDNCKAQAKTLIKQLASHSNSSAKQMVSVDGVAGPFMFHYIVSEGVVYLALCDKGYPKKLAFQYLEELRREFTSLYGPQIDTATKAYAFIRFDTFIQRTKKLYLDTRTQRNIDLLSQEVADVHSIMTRSLADVLGIGDTLNRTADNASRLMEDSKKYHKKTKDLYTQALLRKYMPFAVVVGIVTLVLVIHWYFY